MTYDMHYASNNYQDQGALDQPQQVTESPLTEDRQAPAGRKSKAEVRTERAEQVALQELLDGGAPATK